MRALAQVHIKHAGTAVMLFNPTQLRGIAPKIQRLASREHAISLRNEGASAGKARELALLAQHPPGPGPVQVPRSMLLPSTPIMLPFPLLGVCAMAGRTFAQRQGLAGWQRCACSSAAGGRCGLCQLLPVHGNTVQKLS